MTLLAMLASQPGRYAPFVQVWSVFGEQEFDSAVIACNTAHLLIDDITDLLGQRPVSLIDTTLGQLGKGSVIKVGLLASPTTIRTGLFKADVFDTVTLNAAGQKKTELLIRDVIAGKPDTVGLQEQIELLAHMGCQKIVLGCTELSVLGESIASEVIIDPLSEVVPMLIPDIIKETYE